MCTHASAVHFGRRSSARSTRSIPRPICSSSAHIRGDLHVHTTASDGKATVEEMGRAAQALGYEYLAICDHTRNVRVVPGLDADDIRRQGEEIAAANEAARAVPDPPRKRVRHPPGRLPRPPRRRPRRARLGADQPARGPALGPRGSHRPRASRRCGIRLRRCLSHPKGRILNHRPENALDLDRVFEVALETGVALEVNGLPDRLDLAAGHVREALAAGVKIVCSTDAHSVRGLGNMELSVATARRGGAPRGAVVNTLPLQELLGR